MDNTNIVLPLLDVNSPHCALRVEKALHNVPTLTAATVENAGQGSTVLSAGRDLNLATVTTTRRQETVWDASNYRKDANSQEVGTTLDAAGKLRLEAGQDIALLSLIHI